VQQKLDIHRSVLAKDTSTMLQIVKVVPKSSSNTSDLQSKRQESPSLTKDALARSQDLAAGILSVPDAALAGSRVKLKSGHGVSPSQTQIVPAYLAGKFSQVASSSEDNPLFRALGAEVMHSYAEDSNDTVGNRQGVETTKFTANTDMSDALPPLSKVPPPTHARQIVPRYLQDDASVSVSVHAGVSAAVDSRNIDNVPAPLRAHDRREAAVLLRLANSLPAGLADMAPVRFCRVRVTSL
jgi:hypothetical protein